MTRIKQTMTKTVMIWPSRIEIIVRLTVGFRVKLFKNATSPSRVGGMDMDPDEVALVDSGRSDLTATPQIDIIRAKKSEMFCSDKPSSRVLATEAGVVVATNKGLAGHVSKSKAEGDIPRNEFAVDDAVSLERAIMEVLPKPSSLTQNMNDQTDLIKYGNQQSQTLMAMAARSHTKTFWKKYLAICPM